MAASDSKKSNIGVWKIDQSFLAATTVEKFVDRFVADHNKGIAEDNEQRLLTITIDSPKITELNLSYMKLLRKKRHSNGWYSFFSQVLENGDGGKSVVSKAKFFAIERVDLILFIGLSDDKLYCITTGAGYYLIDQYIDDTYSFDVVRHMFVGNVKEARNRTITGQRFSEAINYRTDYGINSSEAFGKVWKQLRGALDKDFIKSRPTLEKLLDVNRSPQAEAKSSFTLKKALNIEELVEFVKELDAVANLPLSPEKRGAFRFLDMAKPVRNADLKKRLLAKLVSMFYSDINNNTSLTLEFDFCHPKNVSEFFGADSHTFYVGSLKAAEFNLGDRVPGMLDLLDTLRSIDALQTDEATFEKLFERIKYTVKPDEDDSWSQFSTTFWHYFHGEVALDGETYVLIDKVWYHASNDFLVSLKGYFKETVESYDVLGSGIPFGKYPPKGAQRENIFNQSQAKQSNFWYGDMCYGRYGRAQIELFDLLHDSGENVFVIQTKEGFAGTIRDACSQVKMSAQAIADDYKNSKKMLKAYYKEWSAAGHHKGMTRAEFLRKFEPKRLIFVIAVASKHELSIDNIMDDSKFRSHIAKFEVEALVREFAVNRWMLQIHRIEE